MYDAETDTAYVGEESSEIETNTRTVKVFDCTFKPFNDSTTEIVTTDHLEEIHECIQTFTPFAIRNISAPDSVRANVYWYGMAHGTGSNIINGDPSTYDIPSVDRVGNYYLPRYSIRNVWTPINIRLMLYERKAAGGVSEMKYVYDEENGYCYYPI